MSPLVMHLWDDAFQHTIEEGAATTAATTHDVTIPDRGAGRLAIIYFNSASSDLSIEAGWTQLFTRADGGRSYAWYRVLDGSEAATVEVTTVDSNRAVWWACTVRAAAVLEVAFCEGNVRGDLDPTDLSPSWGSAENLWLSWARVRQSDNTLTTQAAFSDQIDVHTGVLADDAYCRAAVASAVFTAATADEGAWGTTGTYFNPHTGYIAVRLT